jgi:hypothetical protein
LAWSSGLTHKINVNLCCAVFQTWWLTVLTYKIDDDFPVTVHPHACPHSAINASILRDTGSCAKTTMAEPNSADIELLANLTALPPNDAMKLLKA